jgi:hypothetical protein
MIKFAVVFLALMICSVGFSQRNYGANRNRVNTIAKGNAFVYWGYNREFYTKSNLSFVGSGYNLTLIGVEASDRPAPFSFSDYFSLDKLTVPQFNVRAGYYYKNGWALSAGYDHLKYVMNTGNKVQLFGTVAEGVDNVTNLSGTYSGEEFITETSTFHYENTNGMNYIRIGLDRSFDLLKRAQLKKVGLKTMTGISMGIIYSVNDFNFAGQHDRFTSSISGLGISAHAGLRLEFFNHLFFQPNISGGYINQIKVKTRENEFNAYASQQLGYFEYNVVAGWIFRIGKDDCDCPKW